MGTIYPNDGDDRGQLDKSIRPRKTSKVRCAHGHDAITASVGVILIERFGELLYFHSMDVEYSFSILDEGFQIGDRNYLFWKVQQVLDHHISQLQSYKWEC